MKTDEYYMKKAFFLAEKALLIDEVPVGAVLVYKNNVIATAYNKKNKSNNVLKHAELICIEKASRKLGNWRLTDCILYVTLEPCPMCASAIQQARINKIVYGASSKNIKNNQIVEKIFKEADANAPVEIIANILKDDCEKLVSNFFKKKRS